MLAIAALIVGYFAARRKLAGVIGIGSVRADRRARRVAPAQASPSAPRCRPLIGAAVGIPLLIWLIHPSRPRHRDARTVAGAARLGSASVPGVDRLRRRGRRRRRWHRPGPRDSDASSRSAKRSPTRLPPVARTERQHRPEHDRRARRATLSPVTPFITPNGDFYRIDTALSFPRISLSQLEGRHRRHGRQAVDAELRRPAGPPAGRADHHAVLRVERGRRRLHLQRIVPRRDARRPPQRGRRAGRAPSRSSAPASTVGRAGSPSRSHSTAATR